MTENTLVSYDIDADKKFKQVMFTAISSGLDLTFSMGESVRIIKKESTKNFILKGSGKYPPLSPKYFKRKQILSPGVPILTGVNPLGGQSGKLKRSIINVTSDSIIEIGVRSLTFGTEVRSNKGYPYPQVVQKGTRDGTTPGRKFLFFSQRMVREITRTIDADIKSQI